MANGGKYVRAPEYITDSDESDYDGQILLSPELKHPSVSDSEESLPSGSEHSLSDAYASVEDDTGSTSKEERNQNEMLQEGTDEDPVDRRTAQENADISARMDQFEKILSNMASSLATNNQNHHVPDEDEIERSWTTARAAAPQDGPTQSIRYDHISPFPKGIAANKMWEAWNEYIETFEIAAFLGNAFDQPRRTQLLYYSVGKELQAIIRAAKLKPSLEEPDCYAKFVKNIDSHLKSMTDTSAEHEAFSNMRQGKEESTMGFHARLVEKVRLCGYGVNQERFVKTQLLKGMSNQTLAKAARTYGHDTNYIVQSATREEAFDREAGPSHQADVFALDNRRPRFEPRGPRRPRFEPREPRHPRFEPREPRRPRFEPRESRRPRFEPREPRHEQETKRRRTNERSGYDARNAPRAASSYNGSTGTPGRRARCSKCRYLAHLPGETCPALSRDCYKCGMEGHLAAACRPPRHVRSLHQDQPDEDRSESDYKEQVKYDRDM